MDLRCPHRKFAILIRPSKDEGLIEVSCPSRWCGKTPEVVVIHRFSTVTGQLIETLSFKEPIHKEKR